MNEPAPALGRFWRDNGFWGNPFESTNAAGEQFLEGYFHPPRYFDSLVGDAFHPRACVVFAPRGAGKTAQRRMVEQRISSNSLHVSVSEFDVDEWGGLQGATLDSHLRLINELLLVRLLSELSMSAYRRNLLMREDRLILSRLVTAYLSNLRYDAIQKRINSLDISGDFTIGLLESVGSIASYVWSTIFGTSWPGPLSIPTNNAIIDLDPHPSSDLRRIGQIAAAAGFGSIYILVDGVDETSYTSRRPEDAFTLISPLLLSLSILETPRFAFKFFLPDSLYDFWTGGGGRRDRITTHNTEWDSGQLISLLEKRIQFFHRAQAKYDLEDILGHDAWRQVVLLFAEGSPRSLIRVMKGFADEATNLTAEHERCLITDDARRRAIDAFSEDRSLDYGIPQQLRRLQAVAMADFEVRDVSERLDVSDATARSYVADWIQQGLIDLTYERVRPGSTGRQPNNYVIRSICVARTVFANLTLNEFLKSKVRVCGLGHSVLREWDKWNDWHEHKCRCGIRIMPDEARQSAL